MSAPLAQLIDAFAGLEVVVVGEALLDCYLEGPATRLCREAPVPVVRIESRTEVPGGAANTAANLCRLGAHVRLVSVVGDDREGDALRRGVQDGGISTSHLVVTSRRRTLALHRVVASQLLVRFDEGTSGPVDAATERALVDGVRRAAVGAQAVIVSDYGHGVLSPAVVDTLAELQAAAPRVLVVDSKHPAAYRHLRPTAVKPNWAEAVQLLGSGELDGTSERADGIAAHGERILELTGAQVAAVTLDTEGAIVFERGRPPHRTYVHPTPGARATGAGDTFVSALTLALAAGAHTPAAAELASAAAGVVVGKDGTATCSAEELRERVAGEEKYVADLDRLASRVAWHRGRGRRIVFTNGCFDILHRGHITYLNRAKTLGDVLVVGLNDDDGVRRLKGQGRPINGLDDRASVLAALSCVDHILAFAGDTSVDVIEAIRPDLYVKGGDYSNYSPERLREAAVVEALGGEVRILPFMEDRSTTGIIERIRDGQRIREGEAIREGGGER